MEFRNILKKLMKKERLSISQLSRKTGVPVQTLHNWLNGAEPRGLRQLKKIADYFEVSLDYLYIGTRKEVSSINAEKFAKEVCSELFDTILKKLSE